MPLFRVYIEAVLVVEADDEEQAETLAYDTPDLLELGVLRVVPADEGGEEHG